MTFCALLLSRQKQNLQSLQCSGHSSQFQSENSNETLQKFVKCYTYYVKKSKKLPILFVLHYLSLCNEWEKQLLGFCMYLSKAYDRF